MMCAVVADVLEQVLARQLLAMPHDPHEPPIVDPDLVLAMPCGYHLRETVAEWHATPRPEWIDDLPYPETQSYVKKILSTAEDYRRLYGS